METLVKLVGSLVKFLTYFFGLDEAQEKYAEVGVKASTGERNIVPMDLEEYDLPDLGPDREKLIKQAESLYDDDDLRFKWLVAVSRLRSTETGWIIEKSNAEKKFTKWGLTHSAC